MGALICSNYVYYFCGQLQLFYAQSKLSVPQWLPAARIGLSLAIIVFNNVMIVVQLALDRVWLSWIATTVCAVEAYLIGGVSLYCMWKIRSRMQVTISR